MVRGYQSQVKWAGRVPYHAYAWPRALHSRFTDAQALRAGELSRGVGLRGFESHSPHHELFHENTTQTNPTFPQALSELVSFNQWMQRNGYRESTTRNILCKERGCFITISVIALTVNLGVWWRYQRR